LAQRSATAAREIGGIVGDAAKEIARGADLSTRVVGAMEGMMSRSITATPLPKNCACWPTNRRPASGTSPMR
jgi:hypothetical protein